MTSTPLQQYYLQQMGIDIYIDRNKAVLNPAEQPAVIQSHPPGFDQDLWEQLQQQVSTCTRCELHHSRTQTVFGVGNVQADWLIIGEAPGAEEDRQGEPFVGRAGKLLNNMLLAIGLHREQVFIANILKCRPPKNRDPLPAEVTSCEHYLRQQIEMIQPRIILAVGRVAAQNLLKIDTPIGRMRGQQFAWSPGDIPVIVTYHPAYLLRSPREKRKVWQDLQMAMRVYRGLQ